MYNFVYLSLTFAYNSSRSSYVDSGRGLFVALPQAGNDRVR